MLTKFLNHTKDAECRNIVEKLIKNYQNLGCLMNLKLRFLDSHFDEFTERASVKIKQNGSPGFERRFQEKWDVNMLADYCWMLKGETKPKGKNYEEIR